MEKTRTDISGRTDASVVYELLVSAGYFEVSQLFTTMDDTHGDMWDAFQARYHDRAGMDA